MARPHVSVTDHATLRFLQRVLDIDVEMVRKKIKEICEPAIIAGATQLQHDGITFVFNGCAVQTIILGKATLNMDRRREHLDRSKRGV